jgi:lipopolysaccharide/colanic/teichoic acid biosynthesis glycosyltransferase
MAIPSLIKINLPFQKKERIKKAEKANESIDFMSEPLSSNNGNNNGYVKNLLIKEVGEEVFNLINNYVDVESIYTLITSTTTRFNIDKHSPNLFKNVVNIQLVNDLRWINKFFESVNSRILHGGIYIGRVEVKKNRKKKILKALPIPFNWILYTMDFLHKRVIPKMKFTRRIYFYFTKGKGRVITRAETLGRLVSCGFEIINHKDIDSKTWFVVKKVKDPEYNLNPSYGLVYKMPRVGKDGKIILVYKFRTMHPFSEYLQDYVLDLNGYSKASGKIANDFRLTTWGKFLRRYWLDEIPQLLNIVRGEMKLVGVRPISQSLFNQYPDKLKELRIKQKPGCIPPYVALLMDEMGESMEAERIYLMEREKHPFWIDIKYFQKALFNIVLNKIRST